MDEQRQSSTKETSTSTLTGMERDGIKLPTRLAQCQQQVMAALQTYL